MAAIREVRGAVVGPLGTEGRAVVSWQGKPENRVNRSTKAKKRVRSPRRQAPPGCSFPHPRLRPSGRPPRGPTAQWPAHSPAALHRISNTRAGRHRHKKARSWLCGRKSRMLTPVGRTMRTVALLDRLGVMATSAIRSVNDASASARARAGEAGPSPPPRGAIPAIFALLKFISHQPSRNWSSC